MFARVLVFILVIYGAWQVGRRIVGAVMTPPAGAQRGSGQIQDMTECAVCGTYVTGNSGPCDRPDCPRRG